MQPTQLTQLRRPARTTDHRTPSPTPSPTNRARPPTEFAPTLAHPTIRYTTHDVRHGARRPPSPQAPTVCSHSDPPTAHVLSGMCTCAGAHAPTQPAPAYNVWASQANGAWRLPATRPGCNPARAANATHHPLLPTPCPPSYPPLSPHHRRQSPTRPRFKCRAATCTSCRPHRYATCASRAYRLLAALPSGRSPSGLACHINQQS